MFVYRSDELEGVLRFGRMVEEATARHATPWRVTRIYQCGEGDEGLRSETTHEQKRP